MKVPSEEFDGAVFLHLGRNSTTLDLSGLLAGAPITEKNGEAAAWQLSVRYQDGGEAALLRNMSSVLRKVLPVPPSHLVNVPAYSVVRIDRCTGCTS